MTSIKCLCEYLLYTSYESDDSEFIDEIGKRGGNNLFCIIIISIISIIISIVLFWPQASHEQFEKTICGAGKLEWRWELG